MHFRVEQLKAFKHMLKWGCKRLENHTNPIIKEEFIGTKINELGEEISIFNVKRHFGKTKMIEKRIPKESIFTEETLKEDNMFAWTLLFDDVLSGKKLELTPQILKEIKLLVKKGIINKEYAEIFKNNINKEGVEFIENCYKDLAKLMGYKKYPNLAYMDFWGASGFSPKQIHISLSAFPSKADKIKALRHELEHFRQEELVYRAFGEDKYIQAKMNPYIQKLKVNDEFCKSKFGKVYSQLSEDEIVQYKLELHESIKQSCEVFNGAKIGNTALTKQELEEAQLYLNSLENYKTPTMILGDVELEEIQELKVKNPQLFKLAEDYDIEYNANQLERGAKKKENEIAKMFEAFTKLFNS